MSNEFYEIVLETRAFRKSIAGYGQYFAYKNNVTLIKVNKTKAGAVNLLFDICSTFFIRLLLLDILIGIIKFYFVEANTFFLLCLENINKLNIYFIKLEKY